MVGMRLATLCLLILAIQAAPSPASRTAVVPLADGFDFPVGPPDAEGYYKYRGFRANGHLGDDWNGLGGGNTDLGDPVYSIGHGVVVMARDARKGWGNVVIVRHAFREGSGVKVADSFYCHLDAIAVSEGDIVRKGQKVGTIGTNRGMYIAHLHFEVRRNLMIGINRSKFSCGYENYYDPTSFITKRRTLTGGGRRARIPVDTFVQPSRQLAPPSKRIRSGMSRQSGGQRGTFQVSRFSDLIGR